MPQKKNFTRGPVSLSKVFFWVGFLGAVLVVKVFGRGGGGRASKTAPVKTVFFFQKLHSPLSYGYKTDIRKTAQNRKR